MTAFMNEFMKKLPNYNDADLDDRDDKNDEIIKTSIDFTLTAYFFDIISENSLPEERRDRSVNHLKALI